MKLIRFGQSGKEKPGLQLADGTRVDASDFGEDWNEAFFDKDGLTRLQTWADANAESAPRVDASERLGPAVARPSKLVCIGLNFADHAKESGLEPPSEPIIFFKSTTAWSGPNDDLIIPKNSQKTDWEVELAFVIGKKTQHVSEAEALDYVAGYALHNDVSEREWQIERGGQWVKGKSADTFAPFGPFLATKDEIADVNNLAMWLDVNGARKQTGSTATFIFNIPQVVSYLSKFMTLLPGDVISTGTPPGVGLGFNPPQYLKAGDVVELGIDGLGDQRQTCVAWTG